MDERKIVYGFYETVRRTFFACRVAGYLPISGLLNQDGKSTRCVWISMYTIYYVTSLMLLVVFGVIHLHQALHKSGFQDIGGLIFQCFAVASCAFLIELTFKWQTMIKEIEEVERLLPPFKNPERVFKIINRIMLFILMLGIANYVLQLTLSVRMVYYVTNKRNDTLSIENYYKIYDKWLFDNVSFNYVTAFVIQFSKLQLLFAFFFIDSFIIVVALYLIYRFRNFNRIMRIKQKQCEKNRNVFWMDLQAHYTRLTRLVKIIDVYINPFVLLSFLANLIFTCKNVYDTIDMAQMPSIVSDWIVIWETIARLIYLAFRLSAVSILTAHIHILSREPLKLLHTLPASAYNLEVQRFMDQVYHTKITLSGFGFFHITRGSILSMLSTIVTYVLVLLQLPHIYAMK